MPGSFPDLPYDSILKSVQSSTTANPAPPGSPGTSVAPTNVAAPEAHLSQTCVDGLPTPLGLCVRQTVDIGIAVPFLIFALGYTMTVLQRRRDRRNSRDGYFRALKTEVDLNVDGLEEAIRDFPDMSVISAFLLQNPGNRPHLMSFYTNDVYKSNLDQLNFFQPSMISVIVDFYQELDFVGRLVTSIQNPSFITISQAGKERVFSELQEGLNLAIEKGEGVKRKLALLVPNG